MGSKLLESLSSHLSQKSSSHHPQRSSSESHADYLTHSDLARSLFGKADQDFLAEQTLDSLMRITEDAMSCLQHLHSSKVPLLVKATHSERGSSILIALGDRPFIINTIVECVNEFESEVGVLLHPVVQSRGNRISLSYLEISALSAEALNLLCKRLEGALTILCDVTDDFSSMLIRAETLARLLEKADQGSNFARAEREQVVEFLQWLASGGLVFLGYQSCTLASGRSGIGATQNQLGILKSADPLQLRLADEIGQDIQSLFESGELWRITKLKAFAPVHRKARMLNISVLELSKDGSSSQVHSFIGILTSRAMGEESSAMPLIRQKLKRIIELEQALEGSHDYKTIVNVFDRMPKDDALRLEIDDLAEFVKTALSIHTKHDTRVSVRLDKLGRGASVLVAMSRERFSTDARKRIQAYLEELFGLSPGASEHTVDLSRHAHANLYFYLPTNQSAPAEIDLQKCSTQIEKLTQSWVDNLREGLLSKNPVNQAEALWLRYAKAFSNDYQALHTFDICLNDIEQIEKLDGLNPIRIGFQRSESHGQDHCYLVLYSLKSEITISRAVPVLENAGLEIINQSSFCVKPRNSENIYVQRFLVKSRFCSEIDRSVFDQTVAPGLQSIFLERSINDKLNSLLISATISAQAISVLRLYVSLLWQLRKFPTRGIIIEALTAYPHIAAQLWSLFELKFSPISSLSKTQRLEQFAQRRDQVLGDLKSIADVNSDKALRFLLDLVGASVRTNYYLDRPEIALKVHSEQVEWMPNPRPKFEIFILGPEIEGTHLRADMVARGGIRWSERKEDFRSEVLGLMKTQKVKNALIVPSGAKGGFIVKQHAPDPRPSPQAVEEAYRKYIRALLSLADNRVSGEVVHPQGVLCYDGPDPYFVVAADKGTSTFSDVANRIAVEEFNFWLGDAFASGGSQGYDHKVYGITAKGAWECVIRHFHDLGVDYNNQSFSAVGIGDMSGDVFGNGLLLSQQVKLLAAFDHRHVFIDPDPDPHTSFAERQRLFNLSRSSWSDYNPAHISKGGGVFKRGEKEIRITDEMRQALSIAAEEPEFVSGEHLISLVLRAKVDLLWNGGIGTYVKSRSESHSDVSDSSNDNVRINADELRVKVVGEGGNLGFTQRARIDFALRGGRINTDAIDNSGGVDLSDHEVNLKILFSALIRDGKLSVEQRNQILREMAPAVTEDVLDHNRNHALLVTLGVKRSKNRQDYFRSLISEVHRLGFIDRKLENLPDDEELLTRIKRGDGMLRPELAVCAAAVKMWTKAELLKSTLIDDPFLQEYVLNYFPETLRKRFRAEILAHPLCRNISATQITNSLVDQLGISFTHRMCLSTSSSIPSVVKCAIAADMILSSSEIRAELWSLDNGAQSARFTESMQELSGAHRFVAYWLLTTHADSLSVEQLVSTYREPFARIRALGQSLFRGSDVDAYQKRKSGFEALSLSQKCCETLALAPLVALPLEAIWVSLSARHDPIEIVSNWHEVVKQLGIAPLLKMEPGMQLSNRWEKEIVVGSYHEIRRSLSCLTFHFLQTKVSMDQIGSSLKSQPGFERLLSTISEIRSRTTDVAALSVLSKQLATFRETLA